MKRIAPMIPRTPGDLIRVILNHITDEDNLSEFANLCRQYPNEIVSGLFEDVFGDVWKMDEVKQLEIMVVMTKTHDKIKALFKATAERENGRGNGLVFRPEENGGLFRMRVFLAGQLMIATPFLHPSNIENGWSLGLSHKHFDGIETIELFAHAVNVLTNLYNTITGNDEITPAGLRGWVVSKCEHETGTVLIRGETMTLLLCDFDCNLCFLSIDCNDGTTKIITMSSEITAQILEAQKLQGSHS